MSTRPHVIELLVGLLSVSQAIAVLMQFQAAFAHNKPQPVGNSIQLLARTEVTHGYALTFHLHRLMPCHFSREPNVIEYPTQNEVPPKRGMSLQVATVEA